MLIHPEIGAAYAEVVSQLNEGLAQGVRGPIGVCSITGLSGRSGPTPTTQVVAVGDSAYDAARRAYPKASVVPILVQALPPDTGAGLSRFIDPAQVLAQLHDLAPATQGLVFIHREDVPPDLVRRASAAATAEGLRWEPIAVDGLQAAARAIETLKGRATPDTAVWFHRGVLALNPDILVPPLVRASWDRQFPVVSDDADLVERGLLFALTPDYRWLGRAAAERLARGTHGLSDIQGVRRVINLRTARALGLRVRPEDLRSFDHVDD